MSPNKATSRFTDGIAQVGACGIFLVQILRAIPRSMRYLRYTPKLNSCTTQKRDFARAIMDYDESIRAAISII